MRKPGDVEDRVRHTLGSKAIEILRAFREELAECIEYEQRVTIPRRAEVRAQYRQIDKLATPFKTALDELRKNFNAFLLIRCEGIDTIDSIRRGLRDLPMIMQHAEKQIEPGRGRHRMKRIGHSARELCACVIVEAYDLEHGQAPGATNGTVQQLCHDYWRACGGPQIGKEGDPGNWRRVLEEVIANTRMRDWVRSRIAAIRSAS